MHYVDLTIATNDFEAVHEAIDDLNRGYDLWYSVMINPASQWPSVRFVGSHDDVEAIVARYGSENDIEIQEF